MVNFDYFRVQFKSLFVCKLTLSVVDNIYCTIIDDFIEIERHRRKDCLIHEEQHMIIFRNLVIAPHQILRLLIDLREVLRTMWQFGVAELGIVESPEGGIEDA